MNDRWPGPASRLLVAIACGGTGGHVFPGLAVGLELAARGSQVLLLVSEKQVDQQALGAAGGLEAIPLPAVGLTARRPGAFALGLWRSWRRVRELFRQRPPAAVLSMGGFTSAAPLLAGRACGARTFLHESNAIPGRANRWLARWVDAAFVAFPIAAQRLRCRQVIVTGTPVRLQFQPTDPAACRTALGLEPERPTLLIMGGSQGAHRINQLIIEALPVLLEAQPRLQFIHLTGQADFECVRAAYAARGARAAVHAFLAQIHLALGAATVAVSRAGGSSLAELAAMQVPAVLIPYPHAADNHQLANARILADAGAAVLLEQAQATGPTLAAQLLALLQQPLRCAALSQQLARWHSPNAAAQIAQAVLASVLTETEPHCSTLCPIH